MSACDDDGGTATGPGGKKLSGNIVIDGSSTVAPLSAAAAEAFNRENPSVDVEVRTSGTGGGFEVFCKSETDISDASRAIKEDEAEACAAAAVEFLELRVASDGITVFTAQGTEVGSDELTLGELKRVFTDDDIDRWSDIDGRFADENLTLAGPDGQSGTFDFFNEEVLGEDAQGETLTPTRRYTQSADDNVLVRAIQSSSGGLGYVGYSYFSEVGDALKAFRVGPALGETVMPTPESITSGDYPLSRPLFIYVNTERLRKPHVREFVRYYLQNAVTLAQEQGFVPSPQDALDSGLVALDQAPAS